MMQVRSKLVWKQVPNWDGLPDLMNGGQSFEGLRKSGDSNEVHLKLAHLMQDETLVQTKRAHWKWSSSWDN